MQIAVGVALLWNNIGIAVLAGFGVLAFGMLFSGFSTKLGKKFRLEKMKKKDERIKLTNELLTGMKSIKLYAWEESFQAKIEKVRKKEIYAMRKSIILNIVGTVVWNLIPSLMNLAAFAAFIFSDPEANLDPIKAFVTIRLFDVVRGPVASLPHIIAHFIETSVSLKRLADFFLLEELDESAISHHILNPDSNSVVSVRNGTFIWESQNNSDDDENDKKTKKIKAKKDKKSKNEATANVEAKESFSLQSINVDFQQNHLVAIVGEVGSGKSSLLSAILGEMVKLNGTVAVNGTCGYVAQTPWIQNATVKDNILFSTPDDNKPYYNQVLDACALITDLDILAAGDLTEIGEKGINLSGGQKQRIALARALYSNADIYLLDDPLSAVDSYTARHLFDQAIGPDGVLAKCGKKTRIWATHRLNFLPRCDHIILMDAGEITMQGSFSQLLESSQLFRDLIQSYMQSQDVDEEEAHDLGSSMASSLGPQLSAQLFSRQRSVASDVSTPTSPSKEWSSMTGSAVQTPSRMFNIEEAIEIAETKEAQKELDLECSTASELRGIFALAKQNSISQCQSPVTATCPRRRVSEKKPATNFELVEAIKAEEKKHAESKLVDDEDIKEGGVSLSIFKTYAKALGVCVVLAALMFSILSHASTLGAQNHLATWTDEAVKNSTAALPKKYRNFGIVATLYFCQCIAVFIAKLIMAYSSIRAALKLHAQLLFNIIRTALTFFESTPVGRIVNRFGKDIDVTDFRLRDSVFGFLMSVFQVLTVFFIVTVKLPIFLSVGIPILVIYFLIQRLFVSSMRQWRRLESAAHSPILSLFGEMISGLTTVRAFGKQSLFREKFMKYVDDHQKLSYIHRAGDRWLSLRLEILGAVIVFATSLFGVIQRDDLDPGSLALALTYAASLSGTLGWMVYVTSDVETNIVAVERIDEYMQKKKEGEWSVPSIDDSPQMKTWPQAGEIVFENVVLRYREGLDPALRGLSFSVKPKEKVGIVGRTGAGKSSLSVALLRLVEIDSGRITIDGVDVKNIGIHLLRRAVTPIPQDSTLFSGTLRFNLDPFSKHTDEELYNCLGLVNMRSFVDADPKGLDLTVAENGDNLSAGQRQLMCMARALLRRPPVNSTGSGRQANILIMDEATAAVDVNTDRLVTKMVRTEFKDSTILTIAHRLDTVITYDRILVLGNGKLLEYDTPANLLANKSSEFYKMAFAAGLAK